MITLSGLFRSSRLSESIIRPKLHRSFGFLHLSHLIREWSQHPIQGYRLNRRIVPRRGASQGCLWKFIRTIRAMISSTVYVEGKMYNGPCPFLVHPFHVRDHRSWTFDVFTVINLYCHEKITVGSGGDFYSLIFQYRKLKFLKEIINIMQH